MHTIANAANASALHVVDADADTDAGDVAETAIGTAANIVVADAAIASATTTVYGDGGGMGCGY